MQKLTYKTIQSPCQFEIPKIKGSRFFASLFPVHTKQEIEDQLNKIQKDYYDATHNCYARRLGIHPQQDLFGNWNLTAQQERANDDGEPANTAGKPILSVITGEGLFDVLVVVTRYFWGSLLGVGGLIQAYTASTKAGIASASIIYPEIKKNLTVQLSYDQIATVQYLISKYQAQVIKDEYWVHIQQTLAVNLAWYDSILAELREKQIMIFEY